MPKPLATHRPRKRFKLHSADALKFDYAALAAVGGSLRVVGNLPYNISTPLIFKLLKNATIIQDSTRCQYS
jgi:16S rRNA (adenine1518-N6/adenine1519-N6)-dimethyltransferase